LGAGNNVRESDERMDGRLTGNDEDTGWGLKWGQWTQWMIVIEG
jgi:hypothetical protein